MAKKRMTDEEWTYVLFAVLDGVAAALDSAGRKEIARAMKERLDHKLDGASAECVHALLQALQTAYPEDFRRR